MLTLIETPIIKDMRQTAKALGVVDRLQEIAEHTECRHCAQALEDALAILGAETISATPPPDPRV